MKDAENYNVVLRAAMRNLFCLWFAAALAGVSSPAAAAQSNLTIVIKNIKNSNGKILVCLFNRAEGFPACGGEAGAFKRFSTKARKGTIFFVLKQIPDGAYAISTAHDQNNDNKIDRHFLFGYPTEGAGTSNYLKPPRSRPNFGKAQFQLAGGARSVGIVMHYP